MFQDFPVLMHYKEYMKDEQAAYPVNYQFFILYLFCLFFATLNLLFKHCTLGGQEGRKLSNI